jgi:hypothetical protein
VQFGLGEFGAGEFGAGHSGGLSGTFQVAGSIALALSVTATPAQGFQVAGNVAMSVSSIAGTVKVAGAFQQTGTVTARFTPTSTNSFAVTGEVGAIFLQRVGQTTTCISGPDTPQAARAPNAVF